MIILDAATKSLELVLAALATTNQLPVVAHFVDVTTVAYTPASTDTQSNGITGVTAVAAPAAATQRQVKLLTVYNADTVTATVTIRLNNAATLRTLVKVTLPVGATLVYTDGEGFRVIDSTGRILTTVALDRRVLAFPLGGSKEIGQLIATPSWTPVPSAQRVTIDGDLFTAVGLIARARLEMRTTDVLTSVTLRVQNLTDATTAGTSAACSADATTYNGVNQQQTVALTIAAGVKVYELQIQGGNADTDVLGNGYLEGYTP